MEETPTGLTIDDLAGLTHSEKLAIARWHEHVAGRDAGMPFFGRAIRRLTVEQRLRLATDAQLARSWEARERKRVERDPIYFTREYGSVQPEEGPAIPFDLWDEQEDALRRMLDHLRVIVGKARQLGLTWLALHLAFWLMAYCAWTPKARILCLSKKGTDADELVARTRALNARLPRFLRQTESRDTRDSNWRMKLAYRGSEMRSLMGTPDAARSFTATMTLFDEFAFYRNGQAPKTWTAALPVLGEKGRAIVVSTGNGTTGDGQGFADLWQGSTLHKIFLPSGVHPARRAKGWREAKRKEFLTDDDFEGEYPENEEQMLAGKGSFHVYPHAGIAAALRLGELLTDFLPELLEGEGGAEWGVDWGDFQTFAIWGVALPRGGMYVFDELVLPHTEPGSAAEKIIYRDPAGIPGVSISFSAADQAPPGTNRTFARVLREANNSDPYRYPRQHTKVDFGLYKEGGQKRDGVNTVAYVRSLLDAAEAYDGPAEEASGILAIGPRCQTLAAQMRNLEREADTGKVRKPALDPRHVERGDHGPDALVALMARRAAQWRSTVPA